VARKYHGRVEFYIVYCREAHPGRPFGSLAFSTDAPPSFEQTWTWQERAERAALFCERRQSARTALVDEDGDDCVFDKYGASDGQLIVIDAAGRVALKQSKADAAALEDFLREHVGPLARATARAVGPAGG
jgi:hypothetical protein